MEDILDSMDIGMDEAAKDKTPSLWMANVFAFCVIFFVAFSAALWQTSYLSRTFLNDARDHARLAAEIVKINTQNTIEAKKISKEIISSFLKSQIKFVKYLHFVEPFTAHELFAFSKEAGLFGITIVEGNDNLVIESSKNWLEDNIVKLCRVDSQLRLFKKKKLYVLNSPFNKTQNICVIAGIDATQILKIQESIGLENTLKEISQLSGVKYVRVIKKRECIKKQCFHDNAGGNKNRGNCTKLIKTPEGPIVQVKFDLGDKALILAMDASPLVKKQKNVWLLLLFFTVVLLLCGFSVSFWLYKQQIAYVKKIREYERELYQKQHEASLGRSAATIAHEIRNPLNAVSMGIQRLILDRELSEKNKRILNLLKNELSRTERIISGLLTYARPSKLKKKKILLDEIIRRSLIHAQHHARDKQVNIQMRLHDKYLIYADPDLLFQLFENVFINSFEALNNQGELTIEVKKEKDYVVIKIANDGKLPSEEEFHNIFEPYFTTKTRGTGLGLAICKKIVTAHKGHISAFLADNKFILEIRLPEA